MQTVYRVMLSWLFTVTLSPAWAAKIQGIPQQATPDYQSAQQLLTANINRAQVNGKAKNIILFIGDGMSVATVTAARIYEGQQRGNTGEENFLSFEEFPHLALSKTYNTDAQTPDSAGAATAIVTGVKTNMGMLSVGPAATRADCASAQGQRLSTILELAEIAGKSTGVVTTTTVTHATLASTYAHTPERGWEADSQLTEEAKEQGCQDIAAQLLAFPYGDGPEVVFGGGRQMFLPEEVSDPEYGMAGLRQDGRHLINEWLGKHDNAAYIWNSEGFAKLDSSKSKYALGLFQPLDMDFELTRKNDTAGEPSLAEMTAKAIEILDNNKEGFFLLVEGGRIDHAHHAGNAIRALHDTVALSKAVSVAVQATSEKDTLIIVTADHSHTMTIAGYADRGQSILGLASRVSLALDGKPYTTLGYANGPGATEAARANLADVDTEALNYQQQSIYSLDAETHGGDDVAIYAQGPKSFLLNGVVEQNYIFHVMKYAADFGNP